VRHGHRAARLALVGTKTWVLAQHLGERVVPLLALEHAHGDIDDFIEAGIRWRRTGEKESAS